MDVAYLDTSVSLLAATPYMRFFFSDGLAPRRVQSPGDFRKIPCLNKDLIPALQDAVVVMRDFVRQLVASRRNGERIADDRDLLDTLLDAAKAFEDDPRLVFVFVDVWLRAIPFGIVRMPMVVVVRMTVPMSKALMSMRVLVALDREEVAPKSKISAVAQLQNELGVPIRSIVTLTDLIDHLEEDQDYAEHLPAVRAYRNRYGVPLEA